MKRLAFAVVLSCLTGPVMAACTGLGFETQLSRPELQILDDSEAATPFGTGTVWSAEKDNARINLIGTVHIYDPRVEPFIRRVKPLLARTDLFLLEMTTTDREQLQRALVEDPQRIFNTDSPPLFETLSDEEWARVSEAAQERGIPPALAAQYEPWFLALTLSIPPCAMSDLMDGREGVDAEILSYAQEEEIPVEALEPWDTLFAIFEDDAEDEQLDQLRMGLADAELQQAIYSSTLNLFFDERIGRLWELSRMANRRSPGLSTSEADAAFEKMEQEVLIQRNRNWLPVIEEAAGPGRTVTVAVGAAHLPGATGLVALLENRGWRIERID